MCLLSFKHVFIYIFGVIEEGFLSTFNFFQNICYILTFLFIYFQCQEKQHEESGHEHEHGAHHIPHRVHTENDDESWVHGLVWNIVGYLLIIIPSYFVIRMIKNSDFKEKGGMLTYMNLSQKNLSIQ